MRLFVAVWPPAEVRDALRSISRPERPGVRWTTEESWHVTLRFLGEVADPAPIIEALEAELPRRGEREATLADATSLLGSTLVVPVEGLRSLATLIRLATSRMGEPPRPDPFEGHITVALGGRRSIEDDLVGRAVKTGAGTTWSVGEVAVVKSVTEGLKPGPTAPRYETLTTISLT